MLIRRDRPSSHRFLQLRIALFTFAAIAWLTGLFLGNDLLTAIAIVPALAGVAVGLFARPR